jgi:hypothetical protein
LLHPVTPPCTHYFVMSMLNLRSFSIKELVSKFR